MALNVIFETSNQVLVEWKIGKYYPFKNCVSSSTFKFSNAVWNLQLAPKPRCKNVISLYLGRKFHCEDHPVSFSLGLRYEDDMLETFKLKCTFDVATTRFGNVDFIERDKVYDAVEDDEDDFKELKVFCMIRLIGNRERKALLAAEAPPPPPVKLLPEIEVLPAAQSAGPENLCKNLKDLFLNEHLHDVHIKVGDQSFKAHKAILAAQSPVFLAMFNHAMTEKESGIIEIKDCEPETFKDFLLALYSGKSNHVTTDTALGLYKLSDKYDCKDLKKEFSRCLSQELSVDIICDVIQLASLHDESEMLKNAKEFFVKNAKHIVGTEKWKTLMIEEASIASDLIIEMAKAPV